MLDLHDLLLSLPLPMEFKKEWVYLGSQSVEEIQSIRCGKGVVVRARSGARVGWYPKQKERVMGGVICKGGTWGWGGCVQDVK